MSSCVRERTGAFGAFEAAGAVVQAHLSGHSDLHLLVRIHTLRADEALIGTGGGGSAELQVRPVRGGRRRTGPRLLRGHRRRSEERVVREARRLERPDLLLQVGGRLCARARLLDLNAGRGSIRDLDRATSGRSRLAIRRRRHVQLRRVRRRGGRTLRLRVRRHSARRLLVVSAILSLLKERLALVRLAHHVRPVERELRGTA